MIAKVEPDEGYYFYYKDHLGSTRQLSRNAQVNDYFPYGESMEESGTETQYRFSGKELDNYTGFYYVIKRYLMSEIGRWMVPDPLAEKYPTLSPYCYAANNPIRFIDMGGDSLQINEQEAQQIFINTLPEDARKFVRFNENGVLDVDYLKGNTGDIEDINLAAAIRIGEHETIASVRLTSELQYADESRNVTTVEMGTGVVGFTTAPDGTNLQSAIPGKIDVQINNSLSDLKRAQILGHELYGHARFYIEGNKWEHDRRQGYGGYDFNRPLVKAIEAHQHQAVLNYLGIKKRSEK